MVALALPVDSRVSIAAGTTATTSPWVALWAAAIGAGAAVAVGLVTQWWTAHSQKQQWDRELTFRLAQWDREHATRQEQWERERASRQEEWQREDSLRWLQNRQQAYARLIAALYEWDDVLRQAMATRQNDAALSRPPTQLDEAAYSAGHKLATEALPLVEFMAPQPVRTLAGDVVRERTGFWLLTLPEDPTEPGREIDTAGLDRQWSALYKNTAKLLDAMRSDLELETGAGAVEPASG